MSDCKHYGLRYDGHFCWNDKTFNTNYPCYECEHYEEEMKGVEVHVRLGGDRFVLHRTGTDYETREHNNRRRRISPSTYGSKSRGYSATNENANDVYHWIFIPDDVVGGLSWTGPGSCMEINFKDVKIGPEYWDWEKEWWKDVEDN